MKSIKMKVVICLALLVQSGFTIAQTKTVVTPFGEKVTIHPNANNGLTANNGFIQLGGTLTQPSILTTTPAFTLALKGLQAGATTDNIVVTDANGVLKTLAFSKVPGDNLGNHIATQDLAMSNKSITDLYAANINHQIVFADRTKANTKTTYLYKQDGYFNIWNQASNQNDLAINELTGKTTLTALQLVKGTDGSVPKTGYLATALDTAGNIVWSDPATITTSTAMGVKIVNASYTILSTDYTIIASKLPGDITITLPAPTTSKGRILLISQENVANAAGNEVTVKFNVPVVYSDTLSKNELFAPFYSATGGSLKITLQSDGTNWHTVSSL